MKRRLFALLVMGLVLSLTIGCTQGEQPAPDTPEPSGEETESETEPEVPPTEPAESGEAEGASTLRLGLDVDAGTLDPRLAQDTSAFRLRELLYNGLVYIQPDYSPAPDVAESWENPDDQTWVFHLREGVTFHNGEELTAEDVKYTYDTILDESFNSPSRAFYTPIQNVVVEDEYTVRFELDQPYGPFLSYMDMGIVPREVVEERGEEFGSNPVGTGPYQFVSWTRGDSIELEAFADHFNGPPETDQLSIRIVPDNSARVVALESGDLDFVQSPVSPQDVARLEESDDFTVARIPAAGYTYINLNTADPILSDATVRQALAHLVNREEILSSIYEGIGQIATSPIPPGMWAYSPDIPSYEYDVDRARALLEEAGWTPNSEGILEKDGTPLALTVRTHSEDPDRRQIVEVLQAEFSNVGIQADTNVVEWPSYFEDVQNGRYQVGVVGWLNLTNPDRAMYRQFTIDGPANYGQYENEEVDELLREARATLDQDEAAELYQEAATIIAEEAPYIFLQYQEYIAMYPNNLEGFEPNPVTNWRSIKDVVLR
jgi:peptide/nickel transport system substrate-binding protein